MAEPLAIPVLVTLEIKSADRLAFRVDEVELPDRMAPWPPGFRERYGFGGSAHQISPNLPLGMVAFGGGVWPEGAYLAEHRTLARYAAGDYEVEVRAIDGVGNIGPWSAPGTIQHRPDPAAPKALSLSAGGVLAWDWDPLDPPG